MRRRFGPKIVAATDRRVRELVAGVDSCGAGDGGVIPRLHDSTGCQTGCTTGLTTGWMFVYTIQPVVQLVVKPV